VKHLIPLFLLLTACGSKDPHDPSTGSEALRAEAERVSAGLLWGCDLPSEAGRTDCSGDGMSMGGSVLLDGGAQNYPQVWAAMKSSVDAQGRPWRNPEQVGRCTSNCFSRDGLMGLSEGTLATGDQAPLRAVRAYWQAHGDLLCPDADDGRCHVTPSMKVIVKRVLGEKVSDLELSQDITTVTAEATTNPGNYRSYLVMRKLRLHMASGHLTPGDAHAVRILKNRFPKHLYAQYLDAAANSGNFSEVQKGLLTCLQQWKSPGKAWWGDHFSGCPQDDMGHELVAMARLFQ